MNLLWSKKHSTLPKNPDRTLNQLREEEHYRGWKALRIMMPTLKNYKGYVAVAFRQINIGIFEWKCKEELDIILFYYFREVKWNKYTSLMVVRHPMERFESLYANKFSGIQWEQIISKKAFVKTPKSTFKWITRNIIMSRETDPGPQFNSTLTPNELVK